MDKARRAEQVEHWKSTSADYIIGCCLDAGMSRREARVAVDLIPPTIKRAIPQGIALRLLDGQEPLSGFGIGGEGTGAGKTSAVAALLKRYLEVREGRRIEEGGEPHFDTKPMGLTWMSWPAEVALLRTRAIQDGYVEGVLNRAIGARILFLDDLGSERIKGSYVEDFAASQLDIIIDGRYRDEKPTFYTTNLDLPGMIAFYGARMVSRLCGDNPLVVVEGLKDQRFS